MSNTLTGLIPDAYKALDVVSREMVGFIPSVLRDSSLDRIPIGQTLKSHKTRANTAGKNITPAMSIPAAATQTIDYSSLVISKARAFPFSWEGEEEAAIDAGPGALTVQQDQIAQAMRAAVNEIEVDLATLAYQNASRAYGTAGTTPFGTNLAETAQLAKILTDNGAPLSDRKLVVNTSTGASLRTLSNLTKVNESGDVTMLRQGQILDVHGFAIRESAGFSTVTKGTGTGYLVNNASGYAVGSTAIAVDTGSGTILAGDIITFAGDSNKYVVATALSANTVTIAAPGLRQAVADNAAITVGNNFTPNVAFTRNALVLAARLPVVPKRGDLASVREVITDPRSGISFEIAYYPGYHMGTYELGVAWGVMATKPEHVANLLG